jgi:hypothetical protein
MTNGTVSAEEWITASEARGILKVSPQKLARLLREGVLQSMPSELDKRLKLVRRADVERLAQQPRPKPRQPRAPKNGAQP